uniref:Uncharacterized protein n=1 Tax=Panagrellus redivivus TaxID=6233 RepID=A0A7E5A264_PANRE
MSRSCEVANFQAATPDKSHPPFSPSMSPPNLSYRFPFRCVVVLPITNSSPATDSKPVALLRAHCVTVFTQIESAASYNFPKNTSPKVDFFDRTIVQSIPSLRNSFLPVVITSLMIKTNPSIPVIDKLDHDILDLQTLRARPVFCPPSGLETDDAFLCL